MGKIFIPPSIALCELYVIWVLNPNGGIIQKASWYLSKEQAWEQISDQNLVKDWCYLGDMDWLPVAITKANAEFFGISEGLNEPYKRRILAEIDRRNKSPIEGI